MSNDLSSALRQFSLSVKKTVDENLFRSVIKPEKELFFRWRVNNFQYTDKGVTFSSANGDYITKQSWFGATLKLTESIKRSNEYNNALEQLTNVFGRTDLLSQAFEHFMAKLVHEFLCNSHFKDTDIDALTVTFLKDLREEPLKYGAEVELEGIVLQPEMIVPDFGLTLRQIKIEDLEREVPAYGFMGLPHLSSSSAILNIEFLGRRVNEVQKRVELAIAILRLFKVGSIKWRSYRMYTESITDLMASGILTSSERTVALETYLVTQEEMRKLKKFWQTMSSLIPENFFELGVTKAGYLTIAYKRYSDALLENGLLERRIANAVMGLEALFLKPGEIQELPYRLGIRIGKLFGLLGYDPREIWKIIGDAYKVRNLFAHGGQLSYEGKKRLESKYKDVKDLLLSVLDYLRILIIVMIFSKKGKNEFIDLVDDSLIDNKRAEILNGVISGAKDVAG